MNDMATASQRWDLYIRSTPLVYRFAYPAPEFFYKRIEFNYIHNLDASRIRHIPERLYNGLFWVYLTMHINYPAECLQMPPQKSRKSDDMPELVQNKLTPEELDQFSVWVEKNSKKLDTILPEVCLEGYKLGISWDAYNNCWIATFTGKGEKCVNDYRVLTARSDDYYEVQAMLIFKHIEVYHRGRWENRNSSTRG